MVLGVPKRTLIIAMAFVGVALIYLYGSEQRATDAPANAGCTLTVNADVLNVRSAPSTTARIVGKFPMDATVTAQPTVRNGFRMLEADRWAADRFLTPMDDAAC